MSDASPTRSLYQHPPKGDSFHAGWATRHQANNGFFEGVPSKNLFGDQCQNCSYVLHHGALRTGSGTKHRNHAGYGQEHGKETEEKPEGQLCGTVHNIVAHCSPPDSANQLSPAQPCQLENGRHAGSFLPCRSRPRRILMHWLPSPSSLHSCEKDAHGNHSLPVFISPADAFPIACKLQSVRGSYPWSPEPSYRRRPGRRPRLRRITRRSPHAPGPRPG